MQTSTLGPSHTAHPTQAGATTWFVTRHPGALEWARASALAYDRHVTHLDPKLIAPGDTVIGTLPVQLAASVCARGARYLNLSLDLPEQLRGRELDGTTLAQVNARLEAYHVQRLD